LAMAVSGLGQKFPENLKLEVEGRLSELLVKNAVKPEEARGLVAAFRSVKIRIREDERSVLDQIARQGNRRDKLLDSLLKY
jgi:hypothetical protein